MFLYFGLIVSTFSQSKLIPKKLGFLYNLGKEDNFIFNDEDYFYTTKVYKGQLFYDLYNYKKIDFSLIVQPQLQTIKHQLINEQFITPDQENYLEKRDKYTKLKTINLYGLEFGLSTKIKLLNTLSFDATIGLGFCYIDETTERLAEGFTFIENFSIGFTHKTLPKMNIYVGSNFGHVSNLNFKKPNDGYNILGIEIGLQYVLK